MQFSRYVVIPAKSRAGHAPPLPRSVWFVPQAQTPPYLLSIIFYLFSAKHRRTAAALPYLNSPHEVSYVLLQLQPLYHAAVDDRAGL